MIAVTVYVRVSQHRQPESNHRLPVSTLQMINCKVSAESISIFSLGNRSVGEKKVIFFSNGQNKRIMTVLSGCGCRRRIPSFSFCSEIKVKLFSNVKHIWPLAKRKKHLNQTFLFVPGSLFC